MKVLVVDDEPDIIDTLKLCWADETDIELQSAARGQEALDRMDSDGEPDIMLTDFRMPHMDGIELIGRVKKEHPEVLILMMSAFPDPALKERAMAAGCDRFISKPFDPFQLLEELRNGSMDDDEQGKGGLGTAAWLLSAVGSALGHHMNMTNAFSASVPNVSAQS